ncbi:MAG TPA: flagellar motor protein MotB, partial [Cellvibrio sp.]
MVRRRRQEVHVNQERWLISYADFITLLFAFFVVMYSISQVNDSKYRVLSDTFIEAFNQPIDAQTNSE